jgi:hypothetical protein
MFRKSTLSRLFSMTMILLTSIFLLAQSAHVGAQEAVGDASADVALGTAFTYQGRLKDNNSPANGVYDFQFSIFDAVSGGSQIGANLEKGDVSVKDGYFAVSIDFGSNVFTGEARFLNIGVRAGSSTGAYTALAPRQAITPAPYALALPGVITKNGNVGIGTADPQTKLNVMGNRIRLQNGAKSIDLRADGSAVDVWTDTASLFLTSEKNNVYVRAPGKDGNVYIHGRVRFSGQNASETFSYSGVLQHNDIITVPYGTLDDWNILVSPHEMGQVEYGSEGDNALIHVLVKADKNSDTSWKIHALYRWRYNGNHNDVKSYPGTVNYLIVPK